MSFLTDSAVSEEIRAVNGSGSSVSMVVSGSASIVFLSLLDGRESRVFEGLKY